MLTVLIVSITMSV